jgi:hypothetical protein
MIQFALLVSALLLQQRENDVHSAAEQELA